MHINAVPNGYMLVTLAQYFYKIALKIKSNLYVASVSAHPPPQLITKSGCTSEVYVVIIIHITGTLQITDVIHFL
jgi:hypothetical protein